MPNFLTVGLKTYQISYTVLTNQIEANFGDVIDGWGHVCVGASPKGEGGGGGGRGKQQTRQRHLQQKSCAPNYIA